MVNRNQRIDLFSAPDALRATRSAGAYVACAWPVRLRCGLGAASLRAFAADLHAFGCDGAGGVIVGLVWVLRVANRLAEVAAIDGLWACAHFGRMRCA